MRRTHTNKNMAIMMYLYSCANVMYMYAHISCNYKPICIRTITYIWQHIAASRCNHDVYTINRHTTRKSHRPCCNWAPQCTCSPPRRLQMWIPSAQRGQVCHREICWKRVCQMSLMVKHGKTRQSDWVIPTWTYSIVKTDGWSAISSILLAKCYNQLKWWSRQLKG